MRRHPNDVALIGRWSCPSKPADPLRARQAKGGGGTSGGVWKEQPERAVSAQQRLRLREESSGIRVGLLISFGFPEYFHFFLSEGRLQVVWVVYNLLGCFPSFKIGRSGLRLSSSSHPDRKVHALAKMNRDGL